MPPLRHEDRARSRLGQHRPTDRNDPERPTKKRFVREGTDIHGWTQFVVAHPACFAQLEGGAALHALIESAGDE